MRRRKRLFKFFLITLFLLVATLIILMHVFSASMRGGDDEDVNMLFEEQGIEASIRHIEYNETLGRYVYVSGNDSVLTVFIHGAPGSWDAFKTYMCDEELIKHTSMISVDRLGYGFSEYGNVANIEDQIVFLRKIIMGHKLPTILLVGHSYGAPIAVRYQSRYGDASGIIMLAPVNDPISEKIKWYAYPPRWKLTRWLFPKYIQVASDEKLDHADQLALILDDWSRLSIPVIHVHNEDDGIADGVANMQFSHDNIPSLNLIIHERPGKGHLLPWNDFTFTKELLLSVISNN